MYNNNDKEREMLQAQLAEIDLRRSVIENMLTTMPRDPRYCADHRRQELESEWNGLWTRRLAIAGQIGRLKTAIRARSSLKLGWLVLMALDARRYE